jgi:hypothetical protein
MMLRLVGAIAFGLSLTQASHAAPPKELYGKSVSVTWTETREQRRVGEEAWRQVGGSHTLNIYVSEAGRVFNNESYSTRAGSAERGGQIAGPGKGRSFDFNGRSLVILMAFRGAATRFIVEFDAAFSSCSAQVTRAREAGASIVRAYSGIIKADIEIKSVRVGGVSCGIRGGNVFAN